jgi:hypothetical protein
LLGVFVCWFSCSGCRCHPARIHHRCSCSGCWHHPVHVRCCSCSTLWPVALSCLHLFSSLGLPLLCSSPLWSPVWHIP